MWNSYLYFFCILAPSPPPGDDIEGTPTQTVEGFDDSKKSTSTLTVNLQCKFFTSEANGKIRERGLIINERKTLEGNLSFIGSDSLIIKINLNERFYFVSYFLNFLNAHGIVVKASTQRFYGMYVYN